METSVSRKRAGIASLILSVAMAASALFCTTGAVSASAESNRYSENYDNAVATRVAFDTENVYYTRKEESFIETVKGVPMYSQFNEYPNSCGPTAGAIIVGFYDAQYENLIPNFDPLLPTGAFKRIDRETIPKVVGELYTLMRTNVDDVGVSQPDCINGLKTYVRNHGQNLTYNDIKSGSTVSQQKAINAVNNNHPSIVFCSKMDLHEVAYGNGFDSIVTSHYVGGHVVVAFGVYTVKYYNGTNNFRTDVYLEVATGISEYVRGFMKLNSTEWCNGAYEVIVN